MPMKKSCPLNVTKPSKIWHQIYIRLYYTRNMYQQMLQREHRIALVVSFFSSCVVPTHRNREARGIIITRRIKNHSWSTCSTSGWASVPPRSPTPPKNTSSIFSYSMTVTPVVHILLNGLWVAFHWRWERDFKDNLSRFQPPFLRLAARNMPTLMVLILIL